MFEIARELMLILCAFGHPLLPDAHSMSLAGAAERTETSLFTYAVVASFVLLSFALCVVAVMPLGSVPVVRSEAETVTLLLKAWPLTVVDVDTAPRFVSAAGAVAAPVPPVAMGTVPAS